MDALSIVGSIGGLTAAEMYFVRDSINQTIGRLSFEQILPLINHMPAREFELIPFGSRGFVMLRSLVEPDKAVMVCTREDVWPELDQTVFRMTFWVYKGEEFKRPFFSPCVEERGVKFPNDLVFSDKDIRDLKVACLANNIKTLVVGQPERWGELYKNDPDGVSFEEFDNLKEMLGTGRYVFPFIAEARRQHVYRMDHNLPPVV